MTATSGGQTRTSGMEILSDYDKLLRNLDLRGWRSKLPA